MAKQIFIDEKLVEFLDHFRHKWGKGRPLSYSKTIKRFALVTHEDDVDSFAIIRSFDSLKTELPSTYGELLTYCKALVLKAHNEKKVDHLSNAIKKILSSSEFWNGSEENGGN